MFWWNTVNKLAYKVNMAVKVEQLFVINDSIWKTIGLQL